MSDRADELHEAINKLSDSNKEMLYLILKLLRTIYKTTEEMQPFMVEMSKYIDDPYYLSDKQWEFPGKEPAAETSLRFIFQRVLGRRI